MTRTVPLLASSSFDEHVYRLKDRNVQAKYWQMVQSKVCLVAWAALDNKLTNKRTPKIDNHWKTCGKGGNAVLEAESNLLLLLSENCHLADSDAY